MSSLHHVVYERVEHLPRGFDIASLPQLADPLGVVMCPPDFFEIIDVKNPFMAGTAGTTDRAEARRQWEALCDAFRGAGAIVETLEPLPRCEDMVFTANTAFFGIDAEGRTTCVPSRMAFPSRKPEVAPMTEWASSRGYRIASVGDPTLRFEGGGDAMWHPGRRLIWGGYGWRTDPQIYHALAPALGTPVIALALTDSTFYHLDTCFCPIDARTVLLHAPAIAAEGLELVRALFNRVIEVDADEAVRFACNAAVLAPGSIAIDRRAALTAKRLRSLGLAVVELDTSEFVKSGGSVFCMKNTFF